LCSTLRNSIRLQRIGFRTHEGPGCFSVHLQDWPPSASLLYYFWSFNNSSPRNRYSLSTAREGAARLIRSAARQLQARFLAEAAETDKLADFRDR